MERHTRVGGTGWGEKSDRWVPGTVVAVDVVVRVVMPHRETPKVSGDALVMEGCGLPDGFPLVTQPICCSGRDFCGRPANGLGSRWR